MRALSAIARWLGFGPPRTSAPVALAPRRYTPPPPVAANEDAAATAASAANPAPDANHVNATGFNSPHLGELSGQLKIQARFCNDKADRMFLSCLRRVILNEGINLRTMPQAIVPIQRMLSMPDVDLYQVAKTLQLEPAIATRVVGIAGSSLFGGFDRVRSLEEAVVRIGLHETRNIVLAITARTKLFRMPGSPAAGDAVYHHALASGVAGKIIARETGLVDSGEAFVACLLSELGRVVIRTTAADMQRESRGAIDPSERIIARTSEALHGPVSSLIAQSWGFDPIVVEAIHYHHHPSSSEGAVRTFSHLMFAADDLATQLVHPKENRELTIGLLTARRGLGIHDRIEELMAATRKDFNELRYLIEDGRPAVQTETRPAENRPAENRPAEPQAKAS